MCDGRQGRLCDMHVGCEVRGKDVLWWVGGGRGGEEQTTDGNYGPGNEGGGTVNSCRFRGGGRMNRRFEKSRGAYFSLAKQAAVKREKLLFVTEKN